jgi:AraC-like DNA-binding protein
MESFPTLTMAYCRVLTDYLVAKGYDLAPVLSVLGVAENEIGNADRLISRVRFNEALDAAIELTGDPFVGLHAGEHIRPTHYGVLGYVMMTCETPRQVIDRHRRWHQLVAGGETVEYEVEGNLLWLRGSLPQAEHLLTRPGVECNMASVISFARWIASPQLNPAEVCFPYPAPLDLVEYRRVFRCPMRFEAQGFALAVANSLLDMPLPQSDPDLRQMMEAKASRQAAELGLEDDVFLGQLRKVLASQFAHVIPDMDTAATAMNISARTLQRRLTERDTNFKRVLDDTRRDLAISYVRDPQLSLVDIAFLLGFSEQSALNRAFRRWTQKTPTDYRAVMQAFMPNKSVA